MPARGRPASPCAGPAGEQARGGEPCGRRSHPHRLARGDACTRGRRRRACSCSPPSPRWSPARARLQGARFPYPEPSGGQDPYAYQGYMASAEWPPDDIGEDRWKYESRTACEIPDHEQNCSPLTSENPQELFGVTGAQHRQGVGADHRTPRRRHRRPRLGREVERRPPQRRGGALRRGHARPQHQDVAEPGGAPSARLGHPSSQGLLRPEPRRALQHRGLLPELGLTGQLRG